MDTREKLVELIETTVPREKVAAYGEVPITVGQIADHLIANGVTVQEWISVKDKLPEIVCDRFIYDSHNGVWMHQFRFKLGDKDWGVSKELPAELVAEAMDQQNWIPVTERLPEENERVLVYHDDGVIRFGINKCGFADVVSTLYLQNHHRTCFSKVTHWMPLPEVPKGE